MIFAIFGANLARIFVITKNFLLGGGESQIKSANRKDSPKDSPLK